MTLSSLRARCDPLLATYRHAARSARAERSALAAAQLKVADAQTAQKLAQEKAAQVQTAAHSRFAAVTSECLRSVFGEDAYTFALNFSQKRGRTDAAPKFLRGGHSIDPAGASGIGCVDVAAFALRLVALSQARPPVRRLIVADEAFRHLKPPEKFGPLVVAMLEELAERADFQFILVQGLKEYQCGRLVNLDE